MLLLGHVGITLGAGVIINRLIALREASAAGGKQKYSTGEKEPDFDSTASGRSCRGNSKLVTGIDLRYLIVGSMLPDIIDKPLGIFLFGQSISNGRIFSHTLLLLILVAGAGLWLFQRRRSMGLFALSLGIFLHLVLDQIWNEPVTLLWPLLGFAFKRMEVGNWIEDMLFALTNKPAVYIPEIMGVIIIISFVILLIYRKRVIGFIKSGMYW